MKNKINIKKKINSVSFQNSEYICQIPEELLMAFISNFFFIPDVITLSNSVSRGVWIIKKHLLIFSQRVKKYFNNTQTAETGEEKT